MADNGEKQEGQTVLVGELLPPAPATQQMFDPGECGEGMAPADRSREEEQSILNAVAKRLVRARRASGFTQADIALRLGHANLTMISLFEGAKRAPSLRNLQILADTYGVTTDYLLGRTDDLGLVPEEGNQALIKGIVKGVLRGYHEKYLDELATITAISVESASMDRVLLDQVATTSIELTDALATIQRHHGNVFEEKLRGGAKLARLIAELSISVKARIDSKQRQKALLEYDHPVCTVQQVEIAVQQALFAD